MRLRRNRAAVCDRRNVRTAVSDATLEERAYTNPWGLVMEALAYESRSEPVPDNLQDAVSQGVALLVAIAFKESGMSMEKIEELIYDREWSVKLGYNFDTHECECGLIWDDGTTSASVTGKPAS